MVKTFYLSGYETPVMIYIDNPYSLTIALPAFCVVSIKEAKILANQILDAAYEASLNKTE